MRQQLKEEPDEVRTMNRSARVTPVQAASHIATHTARKTSKWQGWPFIAIGIVLILSAILAFAVSLDFLRVPVEIEQDIEQVTGTNSTSTFIDSFFVFALQLAASILYILYGFWLRKYGNSGRLPAYLMSVARKYEKLSGHDHKLSAWSSRLFVAFALFMSVRAQLVPFLVKNRPPVSLETVVLAITGSLFALGLCGLMLIQTEMIYRHQRSNDQDKAAIGEDH